MAIQLIAIDIDGTLINSQKEITPRVEKALKAASQKGVYVVLCTGRPLPGVQAYLKQLDLVNDRDYVVTYNGSLVQETGSGKALVQFGLGKDTLEQMADLAQAHGIHYHAIDDQHIYVPTPDIGTYSHHESQLVGMPILQKPLGEISPETKFIKMMFVEEEEALEPFVATLPASFTQSYNVLRSAPFYLEVLHPEASKGKAIQALAQKLGLSSENVMCIGDQENDADMIAYAGLGVAMENAIDSLKAAADFITTSCDEDGVAVAVEKFVLFND